MSKMKEKEKIKRAERIFAFKERMKENESEYYSEFIDFLYDNKFFNNITDDELDFMDEHPEFGNNCGTLKSDKIEVGLYNYDDGSHLFGIDPIKCFDKTLKCSVHAWFPMNKREYMRFKSFIEKLMDEKSDIRKTWNENASTNWYGEFATFGK